MTPKSVLRRLHYQTADEMFCLEDGYYYWFPRKRGALSAATLRDIANLLDEKNKEWDAKVTAEL